MEKKKKQMLFQDIRYGFLEKLTFVSIALFTVNPFIRVLLAGWFDYSYVMQAYNRYVLFAGFFAVLIYFVKLRGEDKVPRLLVLLKNNVAVTLFAVFGILMIVTTLINGAPYISIVGDSYRGEGLIGFLSYLVYFLIAAFMLREREKKIVMRLFLVSSTLVGAIIFVDYVFLDMKYNFATGADMVLHNSNHTGYYLLLSAMAHGMMFVMSKKVINKLIYIGGFMFMTAVLLMNNTWGCQLALVIGVIFTIIVYSIGKSRFQPVTLVLLAAMISTVMLSYATNDRIKSNMESNMMQQMYAVEDIFDLDGELDGSLGSGRMILWLCTLQYIGERPLLGYGADVTGDRLEAEAGVDRCHCEFLNYAVSFGVPATIIYIVAVFMVYWRGLQRKQQLTEMNYVGLCVAFAYLASSLFGNTMYYTAPFLFIALGMGYAVNIEAFSKE